MKFMMFIIPKAYQSANVDPMLLPETKDIETMTKFNEEMARAGILKDLNGLKPPTDGVRIVFPDRQATIDTQAWPMGNVVGGYWLLEVASQEEAQAWALRVPASDGDAVELRRVFEMEDFPDDGQVAANRDTVERAIA